MGCSTQQHCPRHSPSWGQQGLKGSSAPWWGVMGLAAGPTGRGWGQLGAFFPVQRARRAVLPTEEGSAAGPLPTYVGNKEGRSEGGAAWVLPCAASLFACDSPRLARLQTRVG